MWMLSAGAEPSPQAGGRDGIELTGRGGSVFVAVFWLAIGKTPREGRGEGRRGFSFCWSVVVGNWVKPFTVGKLFVWVVFFLD